MSRSFPTFPHRRRTPAARFAAPFAALSAALVLASCAGTGPFRTSVDPGPVRDADEEAQPDTRRATWTIPTTTGPFTHRVRVESELRSRILDPGRGASDTGAVGAGGGGGAGSAGGMVVPPVERVDSAVAELRTTWLAARPTARAEVPGRVSGSLLTFGAHFGPTLGPDSARALTTPADLRLPLLYAAEQATSDAVPQLTLPRPEECGGAAAPLALVRELWLTLPERLAIGSTWQDSTEYATCRDGIPLTVRVVRAYRVTDVVRRRTDGTGGEGGARGGREDGGGGATRLAIERLSRSTLLGGGTQAGEPMEVEAAGHAVLSLVLDPATGAIVEAEGESVLEMTMRGRRRAQALRQSARITIRLEEPAARP